MPTQLTDCCALPFLRFAKINPMPSVLSFWLQPPVAPAIQLLAPEIEIQDRMQMAGAPVFTWMLPTASAGGFSTTSSSVVQDVPETGAGWLLHWPWMSSQVRGLSPTAVGPAVTSWHSGNPHLPAEHSTALPFP